MMDCEQPLTCLLDLLFRGVPHQSLNYNVKNFFYAYLLKGIVQFTILYHFVLVFHIGFTKINTYFVDLTLNSDIKSKGI